MIEAAAHGLDEGALRALVPRVLAGLVRRGEDFDAAEDALQEALLEALRVWPEHPPRDPRAWLTTVATRRLIDARRSEAARQRREERTASRRAADRRSPGEEGDDTLFLLFFCCHPDLTPASQVALTLRAVGGLTTREIADAFYVPEATMAQRISRAKRTLRGRRLGRPGDLAVVLRVLYLIYTAGHTDRRRPRRRRRSAWPASSRSRRTEPEARGLLALMLLNHARLPARIDAEGRIVPLDRQDRSLWDAREIAEGVRVLQSALAMQTESRPPAGTRSRPPSPPCTTTRRAPRRPTGRRSSPGTTTSSRCPRTRCARTPPRCSAAPSRSARSGGAAAGLRETDRLRDVLGERHRWHAVRAHLLELGRRPRRRRGGVRGGRPPARRTSPSATTWSGRRRVRGPRSVPASPVMKRRKAAKSGCNVTLRHYTTAVTPLPRTTTPPSLTV